MDKDWVTRHSGTIGHSVARHSVDLALGPLGTGSHVHWGARHTAGLMFGLVEFIIFILVRLLLISKPTSRNNICPVTGTFDLLCSPFS